MTRAVYGHASSAETDPGMVETELVPVGYREDVLAVAAGDRTLSIADESPGKGLANRAVGRALMELDGDERLVIESRFGFQDHPMTLDEVCARLGISPETAGDIGRNGLQKIEEVLRAEGFGP
ncbi:MAG TPA: sigma factor-like helix-turn-helix DNA-binding protein [Candidatus Saccharimonadales bacterium]|nr:sigma factor-like helix-turn-helix DNA-binding protein [Candidatus Saccharimonadales bacterium]